MRILHIGALLMLATSLAACSSQNVQPNTALASNGDTHAQPELFEVSQPQPTTRSTQSQPYIQQQNQHIASTNRENNSTPAAKITPT